MIRRTESLERGGDVEFGIVFMIGDDFAQALGLTFGTDSPQDVSQILGAVFGGRVESVEFRVDGDGARFRSTVALPWVSGATRCRENRFWWVRSAGRN